MKKVLLLVITCSVLAAGVAAVTTDPQEPNIAAPTASEAATTEAAPTETADAGCFCVVVFDYCLFCIPPSCECPPLF